MKRTFRDTVRRFAARALGRFGPLIVRTSHLDAIKAELAERQARLITSEQRLSLALEATGDGLWDYRRGQRTYVSPSYCAMLGYPPQGDELQPVVWLRLVHPDDLANVNAAMQRVHDGTDELLAVEYRCRAAGGEWIWLFLRGRVIERAADGTVERMIGTVQNVGPRRLADERTVENQELLRNAFEDSAIGMALVGTDGRMIRVNRPFCDIVGYSETELKTLSFQDITHPDDLAADLAFVETILRGECRHYAMEKRYIRKSGELVWVLLNVGVVIDSQDRPAYFVSQIQNITLQKQHNADLQAYAGRLVRTKDELEQRSAELAAKTAEAEAAQAVAEAATQAKSAFLANISHEIRTPLAAIIGFANLIKDVTLPEEERSRCVDTIARQGQHLLALINDILDWSKIEADKMRVERIECDPVQVVNDVASMMAGRAQDKSLIFDVEIAESTPRRIHSDPTRLRQIVLNLVSNAIKFTTHGGVTVEMSTGRSEDGAAELTVAVSDTGIGIGPQERDELFEPFSQADASTTRRFGGTGLGLAITKRLVDMMEGSIAVVSRPGGGTRFEVRIPAPPCETATPSDDAGLPAIRPGLRVLLAEDGPDNQRLITFYLRHAGITAEVAENGRIALDRVIAARENGEPFDLVLMDMQMPEMDGCAAVLAMREAGLAMPVLALTAHGTADARVQSLRAGCQDHLVKPVEYDRLIRSIARHT